VIHGNFLFTKDFSSSIDGFKNSISAEPTKKTLLFSTLLIYHVGAIVCVCMKFHLLPPTAAFLAPNA